MLTTATKLEDELWGEPLFRWAEGIALRVGDERSHLVMSAEIEGCGEAYDLCQVLNSALGPNWQTDIDHLPELIIRNRVELYLKNNPDRIETLVGTTIIETDFFDELA